MKRTGRKKEWSIAFFCLALLFLSPPLISIFNKEGFLFGVPVSYFLLFLFWSVMIAVVAIGARRSRRLPADLDDQEDLS